MHRLSLLALLSLTGCWVVPTDTGGDTLDTDIFDTDSDSGDTNTETGDHTGVVSGELSNFRFWQAAVIPNVVHVAWDTNLTGASYVRYGLDGDLSKTTPVVDSDGTAHSLLLLGLKCGRTYSFQAVTETEDGQVLESEVQTVDIAIQPEGLPVLAIDDYSASDLEDGEDGFVMFTILQMDNSWIAIVDREGDYVWYLEADDGLNIPSVHPAPDGSGFVYTQNDRAQKSDAGGIMKVDWDGNKTRTVAVWGHHDAIQLPGEDTIAYINVEVDNFDIDGYDTPVAYDNIFENYLGAESADTAEFKWSFNYRLADYPAEPWVTCQHFNPIAYNVTGGHDWTHSNSIMANEDGTKLYMMSKNLDNLVQIDRATNTMDWEMGGRDGTFEFPGGVHFQDSPDQWSHGHMSHIWDGGFCMFDNGYHHDEDETNREYPHSRAIEYSYDESTMTIEKEWEFWLPDDGFNAELGDCRKLANGNHLVAVTNSGEFYEVAGDEIVWHITVNETNAGTGRLTYLSNLYTMDQD